MTPHPSTPVDPRHMPLLAWSMLGSSSRALAPPIKSMEFVDEYEPRAPPLLQHQQASNFASSSDSDVLPVYRSFSTFSSGQHSFSEFEEPPVYRSISCLFPCDNVLACVPSVCGGGMPDRDSDCCVGEAAGSACEYHASSVERSAPIEPLSTPGFSLDLCTQLPDIFDIILSFLPSHPGLFPPFPPHPAARLHREPATHTAHRQFSYALSLSLSHAYAHTLSLTPNLP